MHPRRARAALRTEMFFETFLGLARDGRTNSKDLPLVGRTLDYRGWYPRYTSEPMPRVR